MTTHTRVLSPEQRHEFEKQGYLKITSLIQPEEVERLQRVYDRLFAEQAGRNEGNQYDLAGKDSDNGAARLPQIMHPAKYAPELLESALYRVVCDLAVDLLGPGAETRFEHAIYKPPNTGAATPWHQDAAYWDPAKRYQDVSVWVPLQEATLENGCMHFVPESHRLDVVAHQSIGGDPSVHGLEITPGQDHLIRDAVACPLPTGGATLHGGYTLHYAPANRSAIPRRALILVAQPADGPTHRSQAMSFPWLEQRKTARMQRAGLAASQDIQNSFTRAPSSRLVSRRTTGISIMTHDSNASKHAPLVMALGPRSFLAFVCAAAAVGGLLFGFDTAVISGTVSLVETQYSLSGLQVGWFGSSALMGCIPGALLAGWLGDRLGRRPVMLLAGALFFASALGSMLPPSFSWLIVARWVGGVGVGLASVIAPIYISEFAPPKKRGRLVALYQLSIVIGVLAAYFTNWLLVRNAAGLVGDADGLLHNIFGSEVWRAMFGAEMVPAVLFLGLLLLVPESPRYLVRRGRLTQASLILRKVMGDHDAQAGLVAIQRTLQTKQVPWSELWRPGVRKMLLIAVALSFFGQLSGVNIVIYYGPRILEGAGLAIESAMLYQVLLGVINLVFTIAAMVVIDRFGRRPLLVGGMAMVAASLLVAGGLFLLPTPPSMLIVAVLCVYIACVALSICAVIWVLTPEVLPNRVRERGMAVAVFVNWSTNAVSALLFPWYTTKLGMAAGFLTFGVVCVLSTYLFFRWVPETAGRSLEEIEDENTSPPAPAPLTSAGLA